MTDRHAHARRVARQPPLEGFVSVQSGPRVEDGGQASAVMYRVGGRTYPMHTASACKVCNSEHRVRVENELLRGRSYAAITRHLPEGADLTTENVRRHVAFGHLPMEREIQRAAIEERAAEVGRSVEEHKGSLVDHVTLAREVVQRVYEGISSGEIVPDAKDGVAFAKLLMDASVIEGADIDHAMMREGLLAYMQAAQQVMTPEQMRQFGQILATNPVIQGLIGRNLQEAQEPPAAIEAGSH